MKKASNEEGVASTKNMKFAGSQEAPTQGKDRDFQYNLYENTNFESLKAEYFIVSERIKGQRLMEHLGRYKSRDQKQSNINNFKINFLRLRELLASMSKEADKFKQLLIANGQIKEVKSTNTSCDYEVSFRKKIRKDLKDIETWWIQLFVEGSLKRLVPVLNLLRIADDQLDFGLDIVQWHIETEQRFQNHQRSKGCCCA